MMKRRMRDIDDVEHAERDRHAGGDRCVESAEHQAGDDRIDQEIEFHAGFNRRVGNRDRAGFTPPLDAF